MPFGRLMRVYGHSMMPTLRPGSVVLVRPDGFAARPPRRGEVVAAAPASMGGRAFVKRVVGLPREAVALDGRHWELQDDEYFVMGDRPAHSCDSRVFGPVKRGELLGPVSWQLWPFKRLDPIANAEEAHGQDAEVS